MPYKDPEKRKAASAKGSATYYEKNKEAVLVHPAHIKAPEEYDAWLIKDAIDNGSSLEVGKYPSGQYHLKLKGRLRASGHATGEFLYVATKFCGEFVLGFFTLKLINRSAEDVKAMNEVRNKSYNEKVIAHLKDLKEEAIKRGEVSPKEGTLQFIFTSPEEAEAHMSGIKITKKELSPIECQTRTDGKTHIYIDESGKEFISRSRVQVETERMRQAAIDKGHIASIDISSPNGEIETPEARELRIRRAHQIRSNEARQMDKSSIEYPVNLRTPEQARDAKFYDDMIFMVNNSSNNTITTSVDVIEAYTSAKVTANQTPMGSVGMDQFSRRIGLNSDYKPDGTLKTTLSHGLQAGAFYGVGSVGLEAAAQIMRFIGYILPYTP